MGYLSALTSKRLWVNLLVALLCFVLVLWLAWIALGQFTRHSEKVIVPDLNGLLIQEANEKLSQRDLQLVIIDSIYTDKVALGTVFAQTPAQGQEVKPERKVYLTMNCIQRKKLKLPDLLYQSKRLAVTMIEQIGLELGELDERPDPCDGCVVEVRYKGKPIKAGTIIQQGEKIDLILGSGKSSRVGYMPDIIGMNYAEAQKNVVSQQFNIGVIGACIGCNTKEDSTLAKVYRVAPVKTGNELPLGSIIDMWLTTDDSMIANNDEIEL